MKIRKIVALLIICLFLTLSLGGCQRKDRYLSNIEGIYEVSQSTEECFVSALGDWEKRGNEYIKEFYQGKKVKISFEGDLRVIIRSAKPTDIAFIVLKRPSDGMKMEDYLKGAEKFFLIEFYGKGEREKFEEERYCYIDGELWVDVNPMIVVQSHSFVKLNKIS